LRFQLIIQLMREQVALRKESPISRFVWGGSFSGPIAARPALAQVDLLRWTRAVALRRRYPV
jgi:hypothetical protein